MPLYEYRCTACQRVVSVLTRSFSPPTDVTCEHCGSPRLQRLMTPFAHHRSLKAVWERSSSPTSPDSDYYKDPRNIGRWAEERLDQMGVDLPSPVRQMMDAAREGEMPPPLKE